MTWIDLLDWLAERHGDATALSDDRGGRVSYAELARRSTEIAGGLRDLGVGPGDTVALVDHNSVDFFLVVFGAARLRAIPALVNWRLTPVEIESVYAVADPVAVAAGTGLVAGLPDDLPDIRIVLGPAAEAPAGWRPLAGVGGVWPPDAPRPDSADPFVLGFSSGTTGRPKGGPMRHRALIRSVYVDAQDIAGMYPGARQAMVAPTFHLAGLLNSLFGLTNGAHVHQMDGFDPIRMLEYIEQEKVNYTTVVPTMFRMIVEAARTAGRSFDLSSVEEMSYGASPIAPELVREVMALFPGARLRQFYGMTEVAGALTVLHPDDHSPDGPHLGSAGQVNAGFRVRLVDPEGNDVPDGEPGVLLTRSESLMPGYWNDPAATATAIVDGWFNTGDIAIRDNGYLTIMDRAKDMIVTGGENVYPAEVEATLYEHDEVADVAVIGVPDEKLGERVHALVVATSPNFTGDELMAWTTGRLAGFKRPRSVELVTGLPRNASGKLLKRELRAPHWEGHDRVI